MDSHKFNPSDSDKNLIAEQPGMRVLVLGCIVAFLIGYTTKSTLSPARIATRLEKAASQIHKDVKVQFATAQLSLSDGILPRLAIVITHVRMEAANSCWGSPVMEVDELRLPISLLSAMRGQGPIRDIQADTVSLRLRDEVKCPEPAQVPPQEPQTPPPLVKLTPSQASKKYQNDVRSISIQKLQLAADQYPQYQPEFLNFAVNVKSFEPRVIEVTAKSHLFKDVAIGDYLSHANIYLQYKEQPEKTVQAHFFGNWREGHYSLIANYTMDENLLAVETDLKHIPLSQIVGILQKYDLASKELNARQVWISTKARSISPVDQFRQAPVEIRDLRLEGDLGEMHVDVIDIASLEPLVYKPIVIDIQKLDIEKLLDLLNRPKKTNVLAGLGRFSGRAEIISDKKMKMSGEHSGLEFVFSNKGQQELQIIDTMVGDVALNNDTWDFSIHRVEPRGGVFIGDVRVRADRDFSEIDIKTRVEEVSFSSSVQKLMTNGGGMGVLSLDADVRLRDGQMNFVKGLVQVDAMDVEGMKFAKTKANVDWSQGEFLLRTQIKSMTIANNSAGAPLFRQVSEPAWWNAEGLLMNSLTGELRSRSFEVLSWKGFQAQVGKNGKISSEGSWTAAGDLRGSVSAREGKEQRRWSISGTRETPIIAEDGASPGVRK